MKGMEIKQITLKFSRFNIGCPFESPISKNQRTNGPVNAHLISGPSISTKHTKPG